MLNAFESSFCVLITILSWNMMINAQRVDKINWMNSMIKSLLTKTVVTLPENLLGKVQSQIFGCSRIFIMLIIDNYKLIYSSCYQKVSMNQNLISLINPGFSFKSKTYESCIIAIRSSIRKSGYLHKKLLHALQ